ncbi:DUF4139 domain-containing protein [Bartonella sp. HY329]|uniref:DUF4139 domain-containing protein n=1 Tax=unclassified Bartonella TaxID=2645622 RepID=UPI0021CA1CC8|nr:MULTISPECIES: DUF4139 domain-containing protein [unclassified Bartonella]UXM95653.1 DUF4139 domain-containing protein [Bartonella sp. HY329]UXN09978.1 DUF4139 domain-containing protein [Bartonella sp. HY328]
MKKAAWLFWGSLIFCFTPITQSVAQDQNAQVSTSDAGKDIAITIYNEDLALIREKRKINLIKGINHINFRDVSVMIKPKTAIITATDNSKLHMIEQNFNYDLLTPEALSEKYIGKEVTIVGRRQDGGEVEKRATILATQSGLVFKYSDRIEIGLPKNGHIKFGALPPNLYDRPTLVSVIMSEEHGVSEVDLAYLSSGFSWKADYVAELNPQGNKISLKAWVTLQNKSGTDFNNVQLQLVAGELNRLKSLMWNSPFGPIQPALPPQTIVAEPFLDYKLNDLPFKTTLHNNQLKQVLLLHAENIPSQKHYVSTTWDNVHLDNYENNMLGRQGLILAVNVYFDFVNDKQFNLGVPLPKGTIRSYITDNLLNQHFLNEDNIGHTAEHEHIRLKIGNVIDVNVLINKVKQKKLGLDKNKKQIYEDSFQFIIKNAKNEEITVEIPAVFSNNFEILQENIPHQKMSVNSARWQVKVAAQSQSILNVKVRSSSQKS